jgi:hypothetical protein
MAKAKKTSTMQVSDELVISMQGVNKWFGNFHVLARYQSQCL